MIFVAAFGKIPRFFWLFFDCSSSVLSPVPSSDPTEVFKGSETKRQAMLCHKKKKKDGRREALQGLIMLHVAVRINQAVTPHRHVVKGRESICQLFTHLVNSANNELGMEA